MSKIRTLSLGNSGNNNKESNLMNNQKNIVQIPPSHIVQAENILK
jgi:hypothetical protein